MCISTDSADVLDEFQQPAQPASRAAEDQAEKQEGSSKGVGGGEGEEDPLSDEFVQELTKNMESFMAQFGKDIPAPPPAPGAGAEAGLGDGPAGMSEDELVRQFERMLAGGMAPSGEAAAPKEQEKRDAPAAAPSESQGGDKFQDVIQATMEKLKQSKQAAGSSGSAGGAGMDPNGDLSQLLAALGGAGGGEGGGADMPELAKMLSSMMDDLMSKDILYEPLKDMHARFPEYLASEKAAKLDPEQRNRYKEQQGIMAEVIAEFESPHYDPENEATRKRVSDLVTKMQDLGTPPEELLGEMPPELAGLNGMLGQEGDENCSVM